MIVRDLLKHFQPYFLHGIYYEQKNIFESEIFHIISKQFFQDDNV
jgi:hypothetical protein